MVGPWALIAAAADLPAPSTSDQSVTVALIATLGTVVVALIGLAAQWVSRSVRTGDSPPSPDPKLGERVAVTEHRLADGTRTLDVLDRHVDGLGDDLERVKWQLDDLTGRFEEHLRRHRGE